MSAVVCLSGGMDSAAALALALTEDPNTVAVSFAYPSKHNELERAMACRLASHYDVSWAVLDVQTAMEGFSSALLRGGDSIPEGHYTDESMTRTVVPGRNLIFASLAVGLAWSMDLEEVWLAIHAGDHAIYPDCRPAFFESLAMTVALATEERVSMRAPYLDLTKGEILRQGLEMGVPYELTRTCYTDREVACGKCGACVERLEAFEQNGAKDPLVYRSPA